MRSDTVFKLAYNRTLDHLGARSEMPLNENALARRLGVSRTTSRKVLETLAQAGITRATAKGAELQRLPEASDKFPQLETTSRSIHVERKFMEWMVRSNMRPGTVINELELSRQFGVATAPIREFLIRFSRYGLVEKKPNSGWLFQGFTKDFALELFEVRVLLELRSIRLFLDLPNASPLWTDLQALKLEHEALLADIDTRLHEFSGLDDRFHRLISAARSNRFITDFHGVIALIFHYHYLWNKRSERARNQVALREHLAMIEALQARDASRAEAASIAHLTSARSSLLQSLGTASQRPADEKISAPVNTTPDSVATRQ
jgi:DNA-binding GntR family transcriptional regulator